MRSTESVVVSAPPDAVFPFVADLGQYPRWLPLVHQADRTASAGANAAWDVEIRARVGPFARSKRLRMELVESIDDRLAVFERSELDGRDHARWALRVELEVLTATTTEVTMHLAYDGALWTGGLLSAVLDEQIRRGRTGLTALVNGGPMPSGDRPLDG